MTDMNYGELIGAGLFLLPAAIFFLWQYKKTKKKLFAIIGLVSSIGLLTSCISAFEAKPDGTYIDANINRHLSDWYIMAFEHGNFTQGKCYHITDFGNIYTPNQFMKQKNCKDVSTLAEKKVKMVHLACAKYDIFLTQGKKRCVTLESNIAKVFAAHPGIWKSRSGESQ
jgi:hypothetical protein